MYVNVVSRACVVRVWCGTGECGRAPLIAPTSVGRVEHYARIATGNRQAWNECTRELKALDAVRGIIVTAQRCQGQRRPNLWAGEAGDESRSVRRGVRTPSIGSTVSYLLADVEEDLLKGNELVEVGHLGKRVRKHVGIFTVVHVRVAVNDQVAGKELPASEVLTLARDAKVLGERGDSCVVSDMAHGENG